MVSSTLEREKTARLFTYLKELSLLKTPPVRDIQKYENSLFLSEIPDEPECKTPLTSKVSDTWIELKKPVKPEFPIPPKELTSWLSLSFQYDNTKTEPTLLDKISNPDYIDTDEAEEENETNKIPTHLYIKDFPEVQQILRAYKTEWQIWRNECIRFDKIQNIYTKLFSIYQKQKKLGEQYELMIGVGLLNWKTPDDQLVHRHILTVPCSFQFDANNGIIRVLRVADGTTPELEQDMLELDLRLDHKALVPVLQKIEELQEDFWNKDLLDSIFRSFVFSLSANGTYSENEVANKKDTTTKPNIYYSPALILRKKTEKGFQQACTTIIEQATNSENPIPQGIKRIFEEIDDYHESNVLSNNESNNHVVKDSTIYFPLEANDEQRKIIENLETRNGVLVQGPPGTGKSHTIANLISHLLATGKRVLITSETAKALSVLKDKIPLELQNLCVSLLGADSKSFKDLEKVVQYISNKKDTWNPDQVEKEITDQSTILKNMKENQALIQQQLRAIREKETYQHHFLDGTYKGTAQTIAKEVHDNRSKYNWLKDTLEMDVESPLSQQELYKLIELLELLNADVQEQIQFSIPSLELLSNEETFEQDIKREREIIEELSKFTKMNEVILEEISTLNKENRKNLYQLLNELSKEYNQINRNKNQWIQTALQDLLQSKFRPWEEFYNQIIRSIDSIKELSKKHNLTEITGVGNIPLSQLYNDVKQLHAHFKDGKGLGIPVLRPKVVKDTWYIIKDVRIDGRKCDSLEPISLLEETIHIDQTLKKIQQMIQDQLNVEVNQVQSRSLFVANIEDMIEPLNRLFEIKKLIEKIQEHTSDVPVLFEKSLDEQNTNNILSYLDYYSLKEEQGEIKKTYENLVENITKSVEQDKKHLLVDQLVESITKRNLKSYISIKDELNKLDEYGRKSQRCEELLQRLKAVFPHLYTELIKSFNPQTWLNRFKNLEAAMNWAKVNSWLIQFSQTNEASLSEELNDLNGRIKQTITSLGASKAWYSTLTSMTEGQRQHLLAWTTSMRKVGKGTGKNAHVHLKDAQKHMAQCRDAIPAWIMPLYRVFDTFDVKQNLFDVVIIDEASQSGPDAVILQYIAKKIIVVGDDKQISPEYVGIKREDVQYLRREYLYDFKLADMLDIENSFFDLANVLFGGRITLREHFRCMPEIIEFSNRISYANTPLVPLRQYPPNRLEPVKTIHIPNGYREGSGTKVVNQPEAEAIVSQIKECVNDPRYKGKSMGVISLQAEGQAQLIERLLVGAIGTEEIEKRNLICGDAYAFQGDERDIIFLSLVAAPGKTIMRALTTEKDKRRFNVAVSRAKDQLWLFHTPTVNDIRNHSCLRYQLISYCENPTKTILESNRALCESDFERSVFDQITARGYKVIPQHEVAGYRIDLVVEGEKGRIAVECDGDQWHGPDRYDYDMNRQRILERCGWNFWRVRGSDYYYDPEQALSSLWETLDYYGVKPIPTGVEMSSDNHLIKDTQMEAQDQTETNQIEKIVFEEDHNTETIQPELTALEEVAVSLSNEERLISETVIKEEEAAENPAQKAIINDIDPKSSLIDYLESKELEVIDKRTSGGALWLIGGHELSPLIEALKQEEITFTFSSNGSKTTDRKPAWFTTYHE